ncbi:MAG TPA: hypothetical protein VGG75_38110 [Trebonia sp.]|jgi:hypothetical protein
MPKRFERHARSAWERGTPGSRRDEVARAVTEPAAKAPGKKDRDLCKAAHWKGPHQPQLRMRVYPGPRPGRCQWSAGWRSNGKLAWYCDHQEVCAGCGKVLRSWIGATECPDFHEVTAAERAVIEEKRAEAEAQVTAQRSRWPRKPPVTGRQGYRRKRPDLPA